jgi:hypothetical protein
MSCAVTAADPKVPGAWRRKQGHGGMTFIQHGHNLRPVTEPTEPFENKQQV